MECQGKCVLPQTEEVQMMDSGTKDKSLTESFSNMTD